MKLKRCVDKDVKFNLGKLLLELLVSLRLFL